MQAVYCNTDYAGAGAKFVFDITVWSRTAKLDFLVKSRCAFIIDNSNIQIMGAKTQSITDSVI